MKKLLLLAASACLFAGSANSQIRFGPEIGLNVNRFSYGFDDDLINTDDIGLEQSSNMGLRIGVAVDICIASHLTLQPGLYYSAKGGEREYFTPGAAVVSPFTGHLILLNGTKVEESVDIGYIEIPLILNYYFDAGPGRFFIGLGPTVGFGVNADRKLKITNPNTGIVLDDDDDIDLGSDPGQIDGTDIGIMFNLGYDFDMGLFIRPFYNWGLSDLSNHDNFTIHNRTFGIGLGWWFGDDM